MWKVPFTAGLDINHDVRNLYITATSPGVIYKNTIIFGNTVSESGDAAPGYVRGFDVLTGKLVWTFHTVPQPGEPGYETWPKDAYKWAGGTNNWSGLALDDKRGAVYFGTGSPSSDFYGGDRAGMNLFSDCVVALDAATGKLKWYYQTIHHDLWDRDIPCPPNLATIRHDGRVIDVVVQVTKDGNVFVLDRDSGKSVFPVEERPVAVNGLPGEHPWPVQNFPVKPLPLCLQTISDSDITESFTGGPCLCAANFGQERSWTEVHAAEHEGDGVGWLQWWCGVGWECYRQQWDLLSECEYDSLAVADDLHGGPEERDRGIVEGAGTLCYELFALSWGRPDGEWIGDPQLVGCWEPTEERRDRSYINDGTLGGCRRFNKR